MADPLGPEPLVAAFIPALNAARKVGGVVDKIPRDCRCEAIVVDGGSTVARNGFGVFRSELLRDPAERNLDKELAAT